MRSPQLLLVWLAAGHTSSATTSSGIPPCEGTNATHAVGWLISDGSYALAAMLGEASIQRKGVGTRPRLALVLLRLRLVGVVESIDPSLVANRKEVSACTRVEATSGRLLLQTLGV